MPTKNEVIVETIDSLICERIAGLSNDDYLSVLEDVASRVESMIEAKNDEIGAEEAEEEEDGEEDEE